MIFCRSVEIFQANKQPVYYKSMLARCGLLDVSVVLDVAGASFGASCADDAAEGRSGSSSRFAMIACAALD